jgi:hypothetical protein
MVKDVVPASYSKSYASRDGGIAIARFAEHRSCGFEIAEVGR